MLPALVNSNLSLKRACYKIGMVTVLCCAKVEARS